MGYTNQKALVSADWLTRHLFDDGIAILDASYYLPHQGESGWDKFLESHIPGAVFFDIDKIADPNATLPHMMPDGRRFAEAIGALGVSNDHHVIVYDRFGLMSAARAWFMFRYFGHQRVSVLDGGLRKWKIEGRDIETGPPYITPRSFSAKPDPAMVWDRARVWDNIASGAVQLADARPAGRFSGAEEDSWPGRRPGHIPGSLNLPYESLLDPKTRTLLPADALATRFKAAGIDLDRPVTASCGSGVTACVLAFGLHLLGHEQYAVYDGSWAEWGLPGDTPVETHR